MNIKPYFIVIMLLAVVQMGCKNFVEDINDDPNNPADAPLEAVLNAAAVSTIIAHEGEVARLVNIFTRQFAGSDRQYSAYEIYNMTSGDFDWDMFYVMSKNADIVVEKAAETNNKLASGIAKVLKAHSMGTVASLWGNVPYSEALRFPEIADPNFDEQTAVYQAVQTLLDAAISDLSGNPSEELNDIYFGGDASAWVAVANTLKARFYLHVGDYANAAAAAAKGVLDPSGDWVAPHTGGIYLGDQNIYFSFGQVDREGYMTANGSYLPALLDPASPIYRGNAKTDESARFDFVYTGANPAYDLNYAGMWTETSPFTFVSAVENKLILAEATLRLNDAAAALGHLNDARAMLAAQFPDGNYEAYDMADFGAGGIAAIAGKSADEALLHEILEEKYASLVGQIEVFNDVRRTDNLIGIPPRVGAALPERLLIPQVEVDANENIPNPLPSLFEPTPVNK